MPQGKYSLRSRGGFAAKCDECGNTSGRVRLCDKLDPKNLRPTSRRLCTPCKERLGFIVRDYGHHKPREQGAEA